MMPDKTRTLTQNKAYWKWLEILSESMNDAGYSVQQVLEKTPSLSFTKANFHEDISKQFISILFKKNSSTELTTKEMLQLEQEITRWLADEFGITEDFPSINSLRLKELTK